MQIQHSQISDVQVVHAIGRLDSNTASILESALAGDAKDAAKLIVDLHNVGYVSSAGLRVLLKAAKLAQTSGQSLILTGLSDQVRDVFDVSGFTRLFRIENTVAEGVAAL